MEKMYALLTINFAGGVCAKPGRHKANNSAKSVERMAVERIRLFFVIPLLILYQPATQEYFSANRTKAGRQSIIPISQKKRGQHTTASLSWLEDLLTQRLHQLVDRPIQILIRPPLLVDLRDRVHHRRVVFAAELTPNLW